uniref:Uncharacterized protein n=1 Tax=Rhizophora mucronata TaxID=61149 RepID=A0A2P2MJW2_RHIMU
MMRRSSLPFMGSVSFYGVYILRGFCLQRLDLFTGFFIFSLYLLLVLA